MKKYIVTILLDGEVIGPKSILGTSPNEALALADPQFHSRTSGNAVAAIYPAGKPAHVVHVTPTQ